MVRNEFAPITPGEMLKEEFLKEYGLSQNRLAEAIGISPNRIAAIVNNRRRITADAALRLALYFGNSPEFWMDLQTHYDLKMARRKLRPEVVRRIKAAHAESEDDWFDYRLENDPRFLDRIESARASIAAGRGTLIEDVSEAEPASRLSGDRTGGSNESGAAVKGSRRATLPISERRGSPTRGGMAHQRDTRKPKGRRWAKKATRSRPDRPQKPHGTPKLVAGLVILARACRGIAES